MSVQMIVVVQTDFLMDFPLPRLRLRLGRFGSTRTRFLVAIDSQQVRTTQQI